MNKYFIGFPVPEDLARVLVSVQYQVVFPEKLIEKDQLHITSLYIGEKPRPYAETIFQGLERRTLPILAGLDTYKRFGSDSLVITLQPNDAMNDIHREFHRLACTTPHKNGYTPHVTIAKGKKAYIKMGCPEKAFTVSSIALYEKPEGGEYQIHMLTRFQ
jgi:2'-5' RNA ligase